MDMRNLDYFDFVVLALATWRLGYMFVKEAGPLDVFQNIRRTFYAGEYDPEEPQFDVWRAEDHEWWSNLGQLPKQGFIGGVLSCIYCMSVWIGFFFTALLATWPVAAMVIALPFALSCIAVMIEMWRMKEEGEGQYYEEITEE
jgi:hypothetical protein